MLVTREMLALVGAASKDTTYRGGCLVGIRLEAPGFAVATDGHMLATLADTTAGPARLEELPALPKGLADCDLPTTIPTDACKQATALLKGQKLRSMPSLNVARLVTDGTGQLSLAVLNGDIRWQLVPFAQPDSMYPDWTRVWPATSGGCVEVTNGGYWGLSLGSELLERIGHIAQDTLEHAKGTSPSLAWTFYGSDKPAEFQAQDHERTLRGILMPMRASEVTPQTGIPTAPDFSPKPSKETTVEAIMGADAQTATAAA